MMVKQVPGICAVHCIVRDACRQRPINDWIGDVLIKVRKELEIMHAGWPLGKGVQFHVVVTLERPAADRCAEIGHCVEIGTRHCMRCRRELTKDEFRAYLADAAAAVAKRNDPAAPAPVSGKAGLTTDPADPRLRRGVDDKPVPQNDAYLVLSEEERAKGFVRPVRRSYTHRTCKAVTTMDQALAETYARNPKFYGATYCCHCQMHRPVAEFEWEDGSQVGS